MAPVREIPYGKVTTYGHIAMLVGTPQRPRQVGVCLKHLPEDPTTRFNNQNVPWQRVINAKGAVSPRCVFFPPPTVLVLLTTTRSQPSGSRNQAEALQAEGVEVSRNAMGEYTVDFAEYGWFPSALPSERNQGDEELPESDQEADSDGN
ncbi:Alkyltransferase-like protein 1 [Paramyrothecium foliicola]|nr:Alkyltransferase-like protein 1 [Paramyrothecium foliicola]